MYLRAFVFNYPIVTRCNKFVFQKRCELEVIYILSVFVVAEGRLCLPKTIEEEELLHRERAVLKSTLHKTEWAVVSFEDWQRLRSVKFPIPPVGGVKVQPLTVPVTDIDALTLN